MGEHLIDGQFQSDKYPWCKAGFFPMKFTDKKAQPMLWEYAGIMTECGDGACASDIRQALRNAGYVGPGSVQKRKRLSISQIEALITGGKHHLKLHPDGMAEVTKKDSANTGGPNIAEFREKVRVLENVTHAVFMLRALEVGDRVEIDGRPMDIDKARDKLDAAMAEWGELKGKKD